MIDLLNKLLASDTETEVLEFKKAERQFDKTDNTVLSKKKQIKTKRKSKMIKNAEY
jgi:Zn-finger nucleic acid-binding protein